MIDFENASNLKVFTVQIVHQIVACKKVDFPANRLVQGGIYFSFRDLVLGRLFS
jgi:hypothetical protein